MIALADNSKRGRGRPRKQPGEAKSPYRHRPQVEATKPTTAEANRRAYFAKVLAARVPSLPADVAELADRLHRKLCQEAIRQWEPHRCWIIAEYVLNAISEAFAGESPPIREGQCCDLPGPALPEDQHAE